MLKKKIFQLESIKDRDEPVVHYFSVIDCNCNHRIRREAPFFRLDFSKAFSHGRTVVRLGK